MSINNVSIESVVSDLPTLTVNSTGAADAKGKIQFVKRKLINVDYSRNPRLLSKYGKDKNGKNKLEWLARSIFEHGLKEAITVSKRSDGSFHLLKGHLRLTSIGIIANEGLAAVPKDGDVSAKPAVNADTNFMTEVKAIVLEGLTPEEEIDLIMDHGTVTKLDRKEEYNSVRIMMLAGFTQQYMADKMQKSRPAISKFVWVKSMPQCVEDAFLSEGPDALTLNDITIGELYAAYGNDKKAGHRPKSMGPEFTARWERFLKEGKASKAKSFSHDDLVSKGENYSDTDIQDLFFAIAKSDAVALSMAIQRIQLRMVPVGCMPPERLLNTLNTHLIEEGITRTVNDGELISVG